MRTVCQSHPALRLNNISRGQCVSHTLHYVSIICHNEDIVSHCVSRTLPCTAPRQSVIMRKDIVSALVTPCTTSTQRGHGFGRILQDASAARTMLVGHCFSRTHAPQWLGPRWTPLVTFDLPPCKSAGAPAAQPVTVSPD